MHARHTMMHPTLHLLDCQWHTRSAWVSRHQVGNPVQEVWFQQGAQDDSHLSSSLMIRSSSAWSGRRWTGLDLIRWRRTFLCDLDDKIIECKDQQERGQCHNAGFWLQDTTTMITRESDAMTDEEDAQAAYAFRTGRFWRRLFLSFRTGRVFRRLSHKKCSSRGSGVYCWWVQCSIWSLWVWVWIEFDIFYLWCLHPANAYFDVWDRCGIHLRVSRNDFFFHRGRGFAEWSQLYFGLWWFWCPRRLSCCGYLLWFLGRMTTLGDLCFECQSDEIQTGARNSSRSSQRIQNRLRCPLNKFQFLLCTCSIVSLPVAMYFQFDFKWGLNIWITLRVVPRACSMLEPHFVDKKFRSYCNTFLHTRSSEKMVWMSLGVSLFTLSNLRGWFRAPPSSQFVLINQPWHLRW